MTTLNTRLRALRRHIRTLLGGDAPASGRDRIDAAVLEDRLLLSATPLAFFVDQGVAVSPLDGADAGLDTFSDITGDSAEDPSAGLFAATEALDEEVPDAGELPAQEFRRELVFIAADVDDLGFLRDELQSTHGEDRDVEVIVLDESRDGVVQISEVLKDYTELAAIHIVSHGTVGSVNLGNVWLDIDNLNAYAGTITEWNDALRDGADLLIYGCDLAHNEPGRALVKSLSELCDCDVAASTDDTGYAAWGGDWDLEFIVGQVEAEVAFSLEFQQTWANLLNVLTIQDGVNGYNGTQDTELDSGAPSTNKGTFAELEIDSIPSRQTLIRFDDLVGYGSEQIAPGSTINGVTLTVDVTGPSTSSATISLHRMLVPWDETDTWTSMVNGLQAGAETLAIADVVLPNPQGGGLQSFSATGPSDFVTTVQEWVDQTSPNYGWAILDFSTDPWKFVSADGSGFLPELTVDFTPPSNTPPTAVVDTYSTAEDTTLDTNTLSNWQLRRKLSFDNLTQTENLVDFPVLIALDASRIDYSQTQDQGQDLRFYDSDGVTQLAHQIELWNESGTSYVWVKVPQIDGASNTDNIWMYYGNPTALDGQDVSNVWNSDYQAVLHLDETSGSHSDSTGNGHNASQSGGVNRNAAGKIDGADQFDGSNDYLWVSGPDAGLQITGDMTLEAWVWLDGYPADSTFDTQTDAAIVEFAGFGDGDPNDNYLYSMTVTYNGDIALGHETGSGANSFQDMGVTLNLGQWYQVTAVRDATAKEWNLFVDGIQVGSTYSYATNTTGGSAADLFIGWDHTYFDGIIDEVRVSNTAKSSDWIAAQYASMSDGFVNFGYEQAIDGVLENDTDADGDPLTAVLVGGAPINAQSFTLNANGSFTYTPNTDFYGVDTFTYKANDGIADSNTVTVTINVSPVNDAPAIALNAGTIVAEGSAANVITTVMLNEGDPDDNGIDLTYTVTAVTTNGTLRLSGTALAASETFTQDDIDNNRLTYDHDGSETVSDSFDFSLADGGEDGAAPAVGTFNITVTPVNEGVTVSPASGLTVDETGITTATFDVVLDSAPTAAVTITLDSNNLDEGTVDLTGLTFNTVNWNVAQTVTITGVDDDVDDGDVGFLVELFPATSLDTNYDNLDPSDVSVTNTDDDIAGITVTPTSGLVSDETGGTATFDVVLDSAPTADVTIAISSSDVTEGTVSTGSGTFTSLNWNTAQTITVTGVDDLVADGNIGFTIVTGAAVSADGTYDGMVVADVSVTNNDDDVAGVTVTPTSGLVTDESGGSAMFDVVLDSAPTGDVTIAISSSDVTEGTVSAGSLTFTSLNWNTAQTITVTGVDDLVADGNIGFTIVTGAAVSADGTYDGMVVADVSVTNNDDDVAGVTVTPTSGLVTDESGGSAMFDVVLDSAPTGDVTIAISSSDVTEGTVSAGSVTFTGLNWNTAQTITVTGVDDAVADGNIGFTIVTGAAMSADATYNGMNAADVSATNNDDDTAGITVTPTSGLVTGESGGTATSDVVLDSAPTADVTIAILSSDLTEGTVSTGSLTFTSFNWNAAQTVSVTGVDDAVADGNIGFTIVTGAAVSTDATYDGMVVADVSVTNNDDDTAGITVTPTSGLVTDETGGTATFDVVLDSAPTADVTITISSSDVGEGTVSAGSLTFTSLNWNAAQTITVTGVDDALADGNVGFTIVTAAAVSADVTYNGMAVADVSVTNNDDDSVGITVTPTSGLVTDETGGTATFDVVLDSAPTADVTITISSSDVGEGTVSAGSLTFTSLNWNAAQTITVTGVDDALADGNVGFTIVTAAAVSADVTYNGMAVADVSVTNNDDDSAGITVTPTSGLATTETGGTATFDVVLDSAPTADVTIAISSSDVGEGTVSAGSLTFTSLNWNAAQTITVTGVDDALADGNVGFTIVTAAAVSADVTYNGMAVADVSVTNNDDDSAGITVTPTSGLVTDETGGTATFDVVLDSAPTADVTITISSSDVGEGTVSAGSLTFTSLNWNAAQTITVTGVDDALADGNVGFTIVTAAAVSADVTYNGMAVADVSVTNNDDESAGITVTPTSGLVTTEAGGTATFDVVLDSAPTADVTIAISSSDVGEGTVSAGSLTFTSLNWNAAQTITVTGVDDALADGNVGFTIVTAAAVSADVTYTGMAVADVSVTNTDDDIAGITLTPTSGLVTTEAGGTATFDVVLDSAPTADVTIAISSSDVTEGTVSASSLTFTSLNWNVAQTITVTGMDDALADGDIGFTIITGAAVSADATYAVLNVADIAVTNIDSDPVITSMPNVVVFENTAFVVTVTAADPNGDTLNYAMSGGADQGHFAIDAATGNLTFFAPPDFEAPVDSDGDNVYEVEVTASDTNTGAAVQIIQVTVTDDNDAPVIDPPTSFTVSENQTLAGTVNATDQDMDTLTFTINNSGLDDALFAIDSVTGQLTFISPPNYEVPTDVNNDGVYEVDVRVTDGNSGTDVETIAVNISNANDAPIANDNSYNVDHDDTLTITAPGILVNDFDEDGDPLSVVLLAAPTTGTLTASADGSLTYTPDASFSGTENFTYQITDGAATSNSATVFVTVNSIGGPPPIIVVVEPEPSLDEESIEEEETVEDLLPEAPVGGVDDNGTSNEATARVPERRDDRDRTVMVFLEEVAHVPVVMQNTLRAEYAFEPTERSTDIEIAMRATGSEMPFGGVSEVFEMVTRAGSLWNGLDQLGTELADSPDVVFQAVAGSAAVTSVFSVGYVIWLLKGGQLLTSLLAQMPAWQLIDPLPILAALGKLEEDDEDDSLETLVDTAGDGKIADCMVSRRVVQMQTTHELLTI